MGTHRLSTDVNCLQYIIWEPYVGVLIMRILLFRVPYLGSPIFGNSHRGPECPPNTPWVEGSLSQDGSTDNTEA